MDITILSQQIVAFLAPLLPYLVKTGEKAGEEIGKKLGAASWEQAESLWHRLFPKLDTKPAAQEAVHDLIEMPDDPDRQAALRVQMRKLFEEDPAFAEDLAMIFGGSLIHSDVEVGNVTSGGEVTGIAAQTIGGGAKLSSRVTSKDVEASKVTGISVKDVKR